jgi:hypothetical protein
VERFLDRRSDQGWQAGGASNLEAALSSNKINILDLPLLAGG